MIVSILKSNRLRQSEHVTCMQNKCTKNSGMESGLLEDNIILDLNERGCDGMNWMGLVHDHVQWLRYCGLNFWVLLQERYFINSLEPS
jgi:hypothetical protein